MQQLIGRRGAVPRWVLDKANNETADAQIDRAIENLKADEITAKAPSTSQSSHRIVRIDPVGWRQGEAAALARLESLSLWPCYLFFTMNATVSCLNML